MTTQVNKIANQPPMNSMVLEGTNVQMQQIQEEDIKNHLL
jgi:hypothetical protein